MSGAAERSNAPITPGDMTRPALARSSSNDTLREAYDEWLQALDVESARGQVIYCYVGPDDDIESVQDAVRNTLSEWAAAKGHHWRILPILAVLLHDQSGDFGEAIAEWTILKNSAGTPEAAQFANFFAEHSAQLLEAGAGRFAEQRGQGEATTALRQSVRAACLPSADRELSDRLCVALRSFRDDPAKTASNCSLPK